MRFSTVERYLSKGALAVSGTKLGLAILKSDGWDKEFVAWANCFLILMDRLKFSKAFRTVWLLILGGFNINFNPKLSTASSLLVNSLSQSIWRPELETLKQSGRAATLDALACCRNLSVSSDACFRRRLGFCRFGCSCVSPWSVDCGHEKWGVFSRLNRFSVALWVHSRLFLYWGLQQSQH